MSATKADTGSSNLIIEMGLMFLYMHLGMVLYEVSIKSEHFLVTIIFRKILSSNCIFFMKIFKGPQFSYVCR